MATNTVDTGRRTPVYSGTFAHPDGVAEQTLLEVTYVSDSRKRKLINAWIDGVNLTQNTTIKAYYKIDAATYREFASHSFVPATDSDGILLNFDCFVQQDFKITLTSAVGEGAIRNVPYVVPFEVVE